MKNLMLVFVMTFSTVNLVFGNNPIISNKDIKKIQVCGGAFVTVCVTFECDIKWINASIPYPVNCKWERPTIEPNEHGIENLQDYARHIEKNNNMITGSLKEIELENMSVMSDGKLYQIKAGKYKLTNDQSNFENLEIVIVN